jgi:hypothetical protein
LLGVLEVVAAAAAKPLAAAVAAEKGVAAVLALALRIPGVRLGWSSVNKHIEIERQFS